MNPDIPWHRRLQNDIPLPGTGRVKQANGGMLHVTSQYILRAHCRFLKRKSVRRHNKKLIHRVRDSTCIIHIYTGNHTSTSNYKETTKHQARQARHLVVVSTRLKHFDHQMKRFKYFNFKTRHAIQIQTKEQKLSPEVEWQIDFAQSEPKTIGYQTQYRGRSLYTAVSVSIQASMQNWVN